jgi:hypothetical protein
MKFFLIVLIVFTSIKIIPQERKYFDAPFGGGGGFIPGWFIPNIDPLNIELKKLGIPDISTGGIFTTGGGGFFYLGFISNLRLGGIGFGGSKSETGKLIVSNSSYNFETIYSISGGGLTIEYTLPFIKNIGVSVGALIGGGGIQIETYRNSGTVNWDDIWNDFTSASDEKISRRLHNNYWIFSPTLNVDIPLYRFVSFRIGGGYQLTLGDDWMVDNNQPLNQVPADLNGKSFFIQSGLFIGFFSF